MKLRMVLLVCASDNVDLPSIFQTAGTAVGTVRPSAALASRVVSFGVLTDPFRLSSPVPRFLQPKSDMTNLARVLARANNLAVPMAPSPPPSDRHDDDDTDSDDSRNAVTTALIGQECRGRPFCAYSYPMGGQTGMAIMARGAVWSQFLLCRLTVYLLAKSHIGIGFAPDRISVAAAVLVKSLVLFGQCALHPFLPRTLHVPPYLLAPPHRSATRYSYIGRWAALHPPRWPVDSPAHQPWS